MPDRRFTEDLATLVHDAMNQFQVCTTRVQMAEAQLARARDACETAAEMMREALVVAARLMGPTRERVEINALVEKTADELGDVLGTGIAIRVAVGPTPLWVHVDQRDLHRALGNLARNAAQAMPYGGTLTIAAMLEAETQMVCVQVRDTGTGMDAETQAHIWEPGFSTKGGDRPRGIGLFQVKKFVEAHGGTVRVESALGAGATLELCFPRALEGAAP